MRNFKSFIKENKKIIIITAIIIVVIAVIAIVLLNSQKNKESSIFSVKEIILYNNASIINNSSTQSLENLSICQYSDLSIYIDNNINNSELTDENTIKKLYIDNISISSNSGNGTNALNYKNPLNFGKYTYIVHPNKDKINFDVISTNNQNNNTDYNNPTFYTDCSNPISLGYLNKDILTNYSVSPEANTISFNGRKFKFN